MRKSLWIVLVISTLLFAFCGKDKKAAESTIPTDAGDKAAASAEAVDATQDEDNPAGNIAA